MRKSIIKSIAMLALMVLSASAWAQDGLNPYLNSTHTYTVSMEEMSNTGTWKLLDASNTELTAGTDYTIAASTAAASGPGNATAVITFDKNITAGTYTLEFSETSGAGCIALRQKTITVIGNTFYVSTADQTATCNGEDGKVHAQGDTGNSVAVIPVNLNTTSFTPDSWNFKFTLSITPEASKTAATIQSVAVGQTEATATATIESAGTYSLGANISGANTTTNVYVTINGLIDADQTVTLTLTGGTAIKGSATTPDNGTGTKTGAITVNGLPDTGDIQAD